MLTLRHRLFFALRPPLDQRPAIAAHRDALPSDVPVADDRLHVTLAITADHNTPPADLIQHALAIGADIKVEPFDLSLDRLCANPSSIALRPSHCPPALRTLHRQLDRRLVSRRKGWSFNPHTTLCYREGDRFERAIPPVAWRAVDFVLIHSVVGATRHIELGRWPLDDRQHAFGF